MSIAAYAVTGARIVRATTVVVALMIMIGLVAIGAFTSHYGQPASIAVVDVRASDVALSTAIDAQESAGLRCSPTPTLTDVILFQRTLGGEVTVLTFDRALRAAAARSGWIRSYCI